MSPSTGVATGHPLATAVGREVLRTGGNAYDAALAVSAALTVVMPHMNGVGGDLFAVVRDGHPVAINASGLSAELATPERFAAQGLRRIPDHGPLAAFIVPGIVGGWQQLAPRAHRRLPELFAPAVRFAREGFRPTPQLARSIRGMPWADADWTAVYRGPGGAAPERLVQPDLARTLEGIASDAGHDFYLGAVARAVERDMLAKGGLLRAADFAAYAPRVGDPLHVRYRGYDVYTTPPNSQGATALIWLNLLARTDLAALDADGYARELLRTMYPAYAYRARYIGDPDRLPFPPEVLRPDFPYDRAGPAGPPLPADGDTTAFSVFDGEVGVSCIQSNYKGFGSGHLVPGTGIGLNDRGCYFSLDPRSTNVLAPRRRTFHTLMATVADGPRLLLIGSMGGDIQPQANVQVITRILDRGAGAQAAVAAPRFAYPASIYGTAPLYAEPGALPAGVAEPPRDRSEMGHCHAILVGDRVEEGFDPRGEGLLDYRRD